MSASFQIHVANDALVEHVKEFMKKTSYSSEYGNCMQEVLVNGEWKSIDACSLDEFEFIENSRHVPLVYDEDAVYRAPGVYIGEVSWLKADLMNDSNQYVPSTVEVISDLVGYDFPEITDEFIEKVKQAFELPNMTKYSLAEPNVVLAFLNEHKGERVFQMSM